MDASQNNANNEPLDWYQDVMTQPKVPMTLRVGCYDVDNNARFDLYGEKDGNLRNLVLQIAEEIHKCSQQAIARKIYAVESPILRLVSRHSIEVSQLEHVELECTTIYPVSEIPVNTDSKVDGQSQETSHHDNHEQIKKSHVSALAFDSAVIQNESSADFILAQICAQSDILIVNASQRDSFDINRFLEASLEHEKLFCLLIVNKDGAVQLIRNNAARDSKTLKGDSLGKELAHIFEDVLLFRTLLINASSADMNLEESLPIQRINDYAQESALKHRDIEPDFEYQGPIGSLDSWVSWHNIFKRFVNLLYSSGDKKKTGSSQSTVEADINFINDTKEKDNLASQKNNYKSHRLFAQFLRADHLAIRYANAHRSSFILIYCLGAFALINAAIAIGFSDIGWLALTAALAEFIALVGIFLIYRSDHKKRYHLKWLEYRSLAEMLRMAPLLNSIGLNTSTKGLERHRDDDNLAVDKPDTGRAWLIIYTESLMRWIGFGRVKIDQDSLLAAKHFLSETIIKSQESYHKNNAHKMRVVGHNLGHFSYILFVLAFVFVSGKLITKMLAGMELGIDYMLLSHTGHILGVLAAICPMFGSAAFAIRNHAEFDISSQRSLAMLKSLKQCSNEIEAMNQPTQYGQLADVVAKTSHIMQSETADWLEIYEVKETEPG